MTAAKRIVLLRPSRPLGVVAALTAASFLLMLVFDATRWNVVTELWGAAAAGTVVWWVLEQHSEQVQRRVWLIRHAEDVRHSLRFIRNAAASIAVLAAGLPDDLNVGLRVAATLKEHKDLSARADKLADDIEHGRTEEARHRVQNAHKYADALVEALQQLQSLVAADPNLTRLTELIGAQQRCVIRCQMFLGMGWVMLRQPPPEDPDLIARVMVSEMARAALVLADTCAHLLSEAGVLNND